MFKRKIGNQGGVNASLGLFNLALVLVLLVFAVVTKVFNGLDGQWEAVFYAFECLVAWAALTFCSGRRYGVWGWVNYLLLFLQVYGLLLIVSFVFFRSNGLL